MLKIKKEDSYQLNENKEEKKYFKKAFIYGSVGGGYWHNRFYFIKQIRC